MKIRLGLRFSVFVVFIALYLLSLLVLNRFFISHQDRMDEIFRHMSTENLFPNMVFETKSDSTAAGQYFQRLNDSIAGIRAVQVDMQRYFSLVLLIISIVSITVFIFIFTYLTRPLQQMRNATEKIREGDYNVRLPESGTDEMRRLKQSFNEMSRQLETTQRKLLQAEKEMIWKEMSRILAHEIKNPLTPIQLAIQRMEEKYELDRDRFYEIFPESSSVIRQEVNNLRKLVQEFSTFAKASTPQPEVFDPAVAIQEILRSYQHDFKLTTDLVHDRKIQFDRTHFYQIFTNILQNAIDASPADGEIAINLFSSRSYLVLEVIDHGKGIKQEDISRIFDPYFTRKQRGTGLGLALVKRLTEVNHGVVRAKSTPNEETRFELIMEEYHEHTYHR